MHSLKEPLPEPCLPKAVQACPKVVAALRAFGFAAAESALTGQTARVQGRAITVGDVVQYTGDGHDTRVGQMVFHAMLRGELLACLSHWPTRRKATHFRNIIVNEEFTIAPSACMLQSVIFTNECRTAAHGPDACPSVSDPRSVCIRPTMPHA